MLASQRARITDFGHWNRDEMGVIMTKSVRSRGAVAAGGPGVRTGPRSGPVVGR